MKRTSLLFLAQKCWRIGRTFSAVSGFALDGSAAGATQTLSTPSRGAIHEIHLPSGLMRPCAFVGLPKKAARGMNSTSAATEVATSMKARGARREAIRASIGGFPLDGGDTHDFDLEGRVGELGFDGGARRGLAGDDPLFPHGVHARE